MNNESWIGIEQVSGSARAEILKGLLEAQGINVVLSQEGIGGSVYPVTVGPLSEVEILVPANQADAARKILEDYSAGVYENIDYSTSAEEDQPETGDV